MSAENPVKAAFEIKKGTWQVMTLSETEVDKHLDLQELLDGLEDGFRGLELEKFNLRLGLNCQSRERVSLLQCLPGVLVCKSQSKSSTSSTTIWTSICPITSL